MSGSATAMLFAASRIALDPQPQFLSRTEGDDAARGDRNLFAGLRVAPRALVLVAQLEVAKTRQFYLLAGFEAVADLLEKEVHELLGLPFVQAQLFKQCFRQLRFGQRRHRYPPGSWLQAFPGAAGLPPVPRPRLPGQLGCAISLEKSSLKRRF